MNDVLRRSVGLALISVLLAGCTFAGGFGTPAPAGTPDPDATAVASTDGNDVHLSGDEEKEVISRGAPIDGEPSRSTIRRSFICCTVRSQWLQKSEPWNDQVPTDDTA